MVDVSSLQFCPERVVSLIYWSSIDIFFIVFPWIKLQEESGYSKSVVLCFYCERVAGKFIMSPAADITSMHHDKNTNCRRYPMYS